MTQEEKDRPARRSFWSRLLGLLPFFATCTPSNPAQMPLGDKAPQGLVLAHTAATSPEADLVRQHLEEAGFHPEYVPSAGTGVFGMTGNVNIYVPEKEAAEVQQFLKEYFT